MPLRNPRPTETSPPAPIVRSLAGSFLVLMLFAALGAELVSRSVPTPFARTLALALAAPCGLYVAWMLHRGGVDANDPRLNGRAPFVPPHAWLVVPLMGLAVFAMVFIGMEDGVFAVVTAVSGEPATRTVTITGKGGGGRSLCRHINVRGVPLLFDRALCATPGELEQAIPGRSLTLVGKGSAVGLNVESFRFGPQP